MKIQVGGHSLILQKNNMQIESEEVLIVWPGEKITLKEATNLDVLCILEGGELNDGGCTLTVNHLIAQKGTLNISTDMYLLKTYNGSRKGISYSKDDTVLNWKLPHWGKYVKTNHDNAQ